MAKKKTTLPLVKKTVCSKCGAVCFHTLVDKANNIYRCNICGNLKKNLR